MKIDLTCPVELWQFSKPTQEEPECTFVLNNLSEKTVISVQVTLVCFSEEEEPLFRQVERIQGLRAGSGERFSIMLLPNQWTDVAGVDLVIEKVWFDDAMIWRRGNAPLTDYEANALPPGRKLDQLRFVAGQDAVGYPVEEEQVWVCVCGRPNARSSHRCCRCGRRMETVFASYARYNVEQIIAVHEQKLRDMAKKAREDAGKLAEQREEVQQKKKGRFRVVIRVAAAVVCLGVIAVAVILWGLPAYRFNQAQSLLGAGQYMEARTAFAQMRDYPGAADQILQCDYLEAKAWMDAGDTDSLIKAAEAFQGFGDYEDSQVLWQSITYQLGERALEARDYDRAEAYFLALGDYQDSAEKMDEDQYLRAEALLQSQSYDEAKALYAELGDYKDAGEKALACDYAVGVAAQEAEEYPEAIARFTALGAYQDAAERLPVVCYLLAEQRAAENDLEAAGDLYLQAGDYLDARLKGNDSLYQLAQERYFAADYEKAGELFTRIIPYLDSESRSWDCVYQQAEAARVAGEYQAAMDGFESISTFRDAIDKAAECRYLLAGESLAQGNLAQAEALLAELGDYQDGEDLLQQARYQIAESAAAQGKYQEAADMFEALGDYQDSWDRMRDSRYQLARNALLAQEYDVAIEAFTALGNYEDARQLLQTAIYEQGMALKNAGDVEGAMALLATATGSEDARRELVALTLAEAQKKRDAGDAEGAESMLLALEDEAEVMDLYNAWQYAEAMEQKTAGNNRDAGNLFAALGNYRDAAAQRDECYLLYYGAVAEPARAAYESGDYGAAVEALDGFPLTDLPRAYQDLPGLYQRACDLYGDQLYAEGRVYEALAYFQRIPDYDDVPTKLRRRVYLLLGQWENGVGERAEFRADGTCVILGESLCFAVDGYAMLTGQDPSSLTPTHRLSNVTQTGLTLRDNRGERNITYRFQRVEAADPAASPSAAPTPVPNEMLVVDHTPEQMNSFGSVPPPNDLPDMLVVDDPPAEEDSNERP